MILKRTINAEGRSKDDITLTGISEVTFFCPFTNTNVISNNLDTYIVSHKYVCVILLTVVYVLYK